MQTLTRPTLTLLPAADDPVDDPVQPGGRSRRAFVGPAGAAVFVGALIRVAIACTDGAPATDETAYLRSGAALVGGDGFTRNGGPELHFPPLVPLASGLVSRVVGDPHTAKVLLTCVASTLLIVPLALIARRLAGRRAGIATAWVAALTPGLSTAMVNRGAGSEAEYLLLVVSATWLVLSAADRAGWARVARIAGGGLVVGLAYLTRPEGLFMVVPLGLAVLGIAWRDPIRLRSMAILGAVFVLPLAACVVPYARYLHSHTGTWELSAKTQDASIEAWHAVARGDREARDQVLYGLDETGLAFAADRTPLTELAREDPSGYLSILRTNVAELGTLAVRPETGRWLSWLLLPPPILLLAAYGIWRVRRAKSAWALLAVAGLPVATGVAFFVQPRYLMLTVALLTIPAGIALASFGRRAWRWAISAVAIGLLLLSTVQGFRGPGGWGHPSDHSDQRAAGEWIAAHAPPDARVMSRSMVVEYYADRPTMAIPYASLEEILAYARHYDADYLVVDWYTVRRLRPQLALLATDENAVPQLRLVHKVRAEGRTTRVFAIEPTPNGVEGLSVPMGAALGFVGDG